jgi:hypothetical protein
MATKRKASSSTPGKTKPVTMEEKRTAALAERARRAAVLRQSMIVYSQSGNG